MRKYFGIAALGAAAVFGPVSQAHADTSATHVVASARMDAGEDSNGSSNVGKWGFGGLAGLLGLAGLAKAAKTTRNDHGATAANSHR